MVRTPRCRLSAIKFLDRRIPRNIQASLKLKTEGKIHLSPYNYELRLGRVQLVDPSHENEARWHEHELAMLDQLEKFDSIEAYNFFYYPNKVQLVNNALLAGLSIVHQEVFVNRAVFDFLISHMPIVGGFNNEEESINIVEGALLTLVKKDFASQKKFFTWFQGHFEEEQPLADDPAIRYVNPALQRILTKFYKVPIEGNDQNTRMQNDMGQVVKSLLSVNSPIQILINLLNDNMPIAT